MRWVIEAGLVLVAFLVGRLVQWIKCANSAMGKQRGRRRG